MRGDLEGDGMKDVRDLWEEDLGGVWSRFFATDEEVGRLLWGRIEGHGDPIALEVGLTGDHVNADGVRFEDGAEGEVLLLRQRIIFVVVAFGAVEGETEEGFADMFDGFIHPLIAIEEEVVASEEAGGAEFGEVVGIEFIGGEHLPDHFIVREILV